MESKKKVDQLSSVGDPQKVKVLILTEQKTSYADFYFMAKFTNVVKLDLSYNKLSTFPIGFTFKSFHSLKTLFLHYNKFSALKPLNIIYQVCFTIFRTNKFSTSHCLATHQRKLKPVIFLLIKCHLSSSWMIRLSLLRKGVLI